MKDDVFQHLDVPTFTPKNEFGLLHVSRYASNLLICKCGREVRTSIDKLRTRASLLRATSPTKHPLAHYLSCGCNDPESETHPQSKETGIAHYLGQRFGRLTAVCPIEEATPSDPPEFVRASKHNAKIIKARSKIWLFQCECMSGKDADINDVDWIRYTGTNPVKSQAAINKKPLLFQLSHIANQNYANMLVPSCGCWILDLPKMREDKIRDVEPRSMREWRERVQQHINKK